MKIRVVIVGAKGVGKSSLLEQIVIGTFSEDYTPTKRPAYHYPYAMVNDRVYEIQLADLPPVYSIPGDSLQEWELSPGFGLRNASAYILAFDLSDLETFHVVEEMNAQLQTLRPSLPVIVAGLKQDLSEPEGSREIEPLVRKQWKKPYVECSSKFNWHVGSVMEELISLIDNGNGNGLDKHHHRHKSSSESNSRGSETTKNCSLQ